MPYNLCELATAVAGILFWITALVVALGLGYAALAVVDAVREAIALRAQRRKME